MKSLKESILSGNVVNDTTKSIENLKKEMDDASKVQDEVLRWLVDKDVLKAKYLKDNPPYTRKGKIKKGSNISPFPIPFTSYILPDISKYYEPQDLLMDLVDFIYLLAKKNKSIIFWDDIYSWYVGVYYQFPNIDKNIRLLTMNFSQDHDNPELILYGREEFIDSFHWDID